MMRKQISKILERKPLYLSKMANKLCRNRKKEEEKTGIMEAGERLRSVREGFCFPPVDGAKAPEGFWMVLQMKTAKNLENTLLIQLKIS